MALFKMLKRVMCKNIATTGSRLVGILGPLTIPPLQIATLYYFWQDYSRIVDKRYCSCSCWDTVFKGNKHFKTFHEYATNSNFVCRLIRIWYRSLQTHVLQRHLKHAKNMDTRGNWNHRILRNDETPSETGDQTKTQAINDAPLLDRSVLQLLFVVGLH